ncbi:MAG TPA: hypothetical protein VFD56_08885, partial [Chitinophagaceae bacterium]|nr:hypothetical protein [Chitinophagaceae bacterium]
MRITKNHTFSSMYNFLKGANVISGYVLLVTVFALFPYCSNKKNSPKSGPVEASEALATFQIADGFKMEMVASEPLVTDPVDMEIDENGIMYVVEMHGYPLDKSGSGNIIIL